MLDANKLASMLNHAELCKAGVTHMEDQFQGRQMLPQQQVIGHGCQLPFPLQPTCSFSSIAGAPQA